MRLCCPAKINLHLRVGRRRPSDGFHPLLTWMTTVGLFDTLTIDARHPAGGGDDAPAAGPILRLGGGRDAPPGLPCDASNLVVRAADAFAAAIRTSAVNEGGQSDGR